MRLLYNLSVRGYSFLVRVASLWNPKAKKWIVGRKDSWKRLATWQRKDLPVYWFHCASLGEFEQGRPLMEALKRREACQLVLTFFSPSGYEVRKNYEIADLVIYLPQETQRNSKRFLDFIKPNKVFFIKYEFWAEYIINAVNSGAKVYSVAATFREKQLFFKWYGGYMRNLLKRFDQVFVQDTTSVDLLKTIDVASLEVGDPRYDRVMANALKVQSYKEIERFVAGHDVLVVGSSWADDEAVYFEWLNNGGFKGKVIIAPHEVTPARITEIESGLKLRCGRYSNSGDIDLTAIDVLLIDNVGMLMNVYQYATVAYVGGGFGSGLHNILEPACFGMPVLFGDKHAKFREAQDFIDNGVGASISNKQELDEQFKALINEGKKEKVIAFMQSRTGATQKILAKL